MTVVIFVATHWGTRHGGVNSFNQDLVRAAAGTAGAAVTVACAVPRPQRHEIDQAARDDGVTLLDLGRVKPNGDLRRVRKALVRSWEQRLGPITWIVGHDIVSGGWAIEAATAVTGAQAAVVLHTHYPAYASFRAKEGEGIHVRQERTVDILKRAHVVFAVGPTLEKAASDYLGRSKEVFTLIPGLAERPGRSTQPETFHAITSGRLTSEDDRLKQGSLAVVALSRLRRTAPELIGPDPRISVVGVEDGREPELRRLAGKEAGRLVPVNCRGYVEDRNRVRNLLGSSSVCLMLSVHEGFGLTGWEALSAEVPLVLSKNTGLYALLEGVGGPALGCVRVVDVQGSSDEPFYTDADIENVTAALRDIAHRGNVAKKDAQHLRQSMAEYTWPRAAEEFLTRLGLVVRPSSGSGSRFLTPPPPVIPALLRDRRVERDHLRVRLLWRDRRVVVLNGPRGVGKTAMVSQLMTDFAEASGTGGFAQLDYLSGTGHLAVTGARLIEHLRRMASAEAVNIPGQLGPELPPDWFERVEDVLRLLTRDVLIVIDQAEELIDGKGRFQDRGLDRLVSELARRTDHRVSLLVVSAADLHPSLLGDNGAQPFRIGPLTPPEKAVELLQDLLEGAADGLLNDDLILEGTRAVQLTGYHPRNAELLVAAFSTDPTFSMDDLEGLAGAPPSAYTTMLTDRVLGNLSAERLAVVRGLALLALPSTATAVAGFLKDFLRAPVVRSALAHLTRIRFIRCCDGVYDISPAEAQAILKAWWAVPDGEASRRAFLLRAANHFGEQRQAQREPLSVEQLAVHFREIRLRLDHRGETQVRAAQLLMAELDSAYLRRWGHQHVLAPWRRELLDREPGTHYWRGNLSALAGGALELDEIKEALRYLDRALDGSTESAAPADADEAPQFLSDRLDLLNQQAGAYWRDGQLTKAEDFYHDQMRLAKPTVHAHAKARALLGLAACAAERGQSGIAEGLRTADVLTRHGSDRRGPDLRARVLLARAELARLDLDDEQALALAREAGKASGASAAVEVEVRALDIQAGVHLDREERGVAANLAERASAAASRTGVSDITRSAHATLALAYLSLKRTDDALSAAGAAIRFFPSKRALIGTVVFGLALVRDGSLIQADQKFLEVVGLAESYKLDDGRPYWVWDALAFAEAGRFACGDATARDRSIEAYHQAREMAERPGIRRRCLQFLQLLDDSTGLDLDDLRAAANRTPNGDRTAGR